MERCSLGVKQGEPITVEKLLLFQTSLIFTKDQKDELEEDRLLSVFVLTA